MQINSRFINVLVLTEIYPKNGFLVVLVVVVVVGTSVVVVFPVNPPNKAPACASKPPFGLLLSVVLVSGCLVVGLVLTDLKGDSDPLVAQVLDC